MNAIATTEEITFFLIGRMSDFAGEKIKESQIPFSQYYSNDLATGEGSWKEPTAFHQRFQPLYAKHVSNFSKNIPWSTSLKVLELGAGHLTDGRSRLSRCLPDEVQVCYTDLSKKTVEHARQKFPTIPYLHINSSNMSENIESSSQDVVISSCFLDTLPQEDLTATLAEIARVLKPGGTFFHISDLEPYFNTLVIDNKDDPDVMFPWLDSDKFIKGIQFVPRDICEQFISRHSNAYPFLKNYIDLPNDVRAAVVIEICLMKDFALTLSNWVKRHLSPVREIVNEQFYDQRLRNGLEITHFAIDTLKNIMESAIYPKEESGETQYNDVYSFHGRLIEKTAPRDTVRKTLIAHTIIARKVESTS